MIQRFEQAQRLNNSKPPGSLASQPPSHPRIINYELRAISYELGISDAFSLFPTSYQLSATSWRGSASPFSFYLYPFSFILSLTNLSTIRTIVSKAGDSPLDWW
jgi:hypothetical protein